MTVFESLGLKIVKEKPRSSSRNCFGIRALPFRAGWGKRFHFLVLLVVSLLFGFMESGAGGRGDNPGVSVPPMGIEWPPITNEERPWAYWWWMGSAVDKTNLTRELTRYRDAGYGGVHIIPIYGAKGWDSNYISYLSPRWMEMMSHAVAEARRMDMDVDMTTGTGWCFGGGPYVGEQEGNANVVVRTLDLVGGSKLTEKFDAKKTQALVAFPNPLTPSLSLSDSEAVAEGRVRGGSPSTPIDLTKKITSDGSVNWTAPAGGWKVYAVSQKLNGQKVKRAALGGEGPMLNLIYPDAMAVFLRSHTEAFDAFKGPKPRAQYHDSYEYKSDWSPDFFKQFEKRRGYKLQTELPSLFSVDRSRRREEADSANTNRLLTSAATERTARVLADYRETVSDVMIEDSLPQWVKWSHKRGFITRNEAHGSPGNLLDLYALADVPETEMFRLDRNKLISKFASSAAHVGGRKLVGCETGTWLKEHFTETLADMKYLLDDLFVSGVNHVFYHGTCYSPDEAGWPGWVFYASYEMNPRNSIWHDARALNDYVARCQSILQSGQPDNDILLYWPLHDYWQQAGPETLLPHLTVHARGWFESQPIGNTAEQLWNRGYSFDYISDRQLATAKVGRDGIKVAGGNYRVIVVPPCDVIPLPTMEKLLSLAKAGATVIFQDELPRDVPGLGKLEKRRAQLKKLSNEIASRSRGGNEPASSSTDRVLTSATMGRGRVLIGGLEAGLGAAGVSREAMFDHAGLMCIRRSIEGGRYYFIANRGEQAVESWIPLATVARSSVLMDPMSGRIGLAASRKAGKQATEVYLQLKPGESVVVRTLHDGGNGTVSPHWDYWQPQPGATQINGEWRLEFISGGPDLPPALTSDKLGSWTDLGGDGAKSFAGTARYSVKFDVPGAGTWTGPKAFALDLGNVAQSARVRLNGRDLGTLLIPPFRVVVDNLKPAGNDLEVEVTNVSANRIRDLDRRGVKWQTFHDINFVNQDYRPFNAANWPLTPSGLLGPVTLTALSPLNPLEARR